MRVPMLGCSCFLKIPSRKAGITISNKFSGLPPQLVWAPFLIVNKKSEFQTNILRNDRDIRKSQFLHDVTNADDINNDNRTMTIPQPFFRKQQLS